MEHFMKSKLRSPIGLIIALFIAQNITTAAPLEPAETPVHRPQINVSPEDPSQDEPILIQVSGLFPTAAAQIDQAFVERSGQRFLLHLAVSRFDFGPEVETRVVHNFEIGRLNPGEYSAALMVNNQVQLSQSFTVSRQKEEPPAPLFGPFRTQISLEPSQPKPNETFQVILSGVHPTPGFTFSNPTVSVNESIVQIALDLFEPQQPVAQVLTPFRQQAAELSLPEGRYEIRVRINNLPLRRHGFHIDSEEEQRSERLLFNKPVLRYQREGGIAGTLSWVKLFEGRRFVRLDGLGDSNQRQAGRIPQDMWDTLFAQLREANFTSLPMVIESNSIISDGFTHIIAYQGHTVSLDDGAEISSNLQQVVNILNFILQEAPAAADFETRQSTVPSWTQMQQ